jgi:putative spermidine/putrescine transport system substrate-binding protein
VLTQEEIAAIDPAYHDDHGVPNIVWSMILAYNEEMYPTPPQGWADFWDLEKFPGMRTSAGNRIPPIEQAAFAMGVPADQIYETPIEEMMKKIKELGDNIVFATTPQMVQMLASGEVGMAVTSNGRVEDLRAGGKPIGIQWNQGVLNLVYMVVPKGAPNPENARKLLEFMSRPDRQAELAELILFGPVNQDAYALLDESVRDRLPNAPAHAEQQIVLDADWWGENREKIDATWNEIVLGQ